MLLTKIRTLLSILEFKGALGAMLAWPKFSMASFAIVSRLKQGGVYPATVIDVGANVGQFAVSAARLFGSAKIISIEPDERTAEKLRKNLAAEKNAEILVTAVGDFDGEASFHVNMDSQVSSILELGKDRIAAFPQSTVVEEIRVPVATLDTLFMQRELNKPILLKIDVQGLEDKVIRGAAKFIKEVQWVLMEVSFADLYKGEMNFWGIAVLMEKVGFKFVRPVNFHISPTTGEIIEMDVLFHKAESRD